MNKQQIDALVSNELAQAKAKHLNEECNLKDYVLFLVEEAGEAARAVNQMYHEGKGIDEVRKEVIQTIVVGYRTLEHIEESLATESGFDDLNSELSFMLLRHPSASNIMREERDRQKYTHGYTDEKDDSHINDELLYAGLAYLYNDINYWPFGTSYFKQKSLERNLTKATALLLADWTRINRALESVSNDRMKITAQALTDAIRSLEVVAHKSYDEDHFVTVFDYKRLVPTPPKWDNFTGSPLNPQYKAKKAPRPFMGGKKCDNPYTGSDSVCKKVFNPMT